MTKRRKTPQSSFNVSQKDLQGFYNKYLPKMGVGGRPNTSFAYNTNIGRGADALSSIFDIFRNTKEGKYSKANNNNVNKSDYQKVSIKNNFDDNRYIDFGALNNADKNTTQGDVFKTWHQGMAHGITGVDGRGHTGMNRYYTDRSNLVDNHGNPLFASKTYDENTGDSHFNPGQLPLVGDDAEANLVPWGAKSMNFNIPSILSTDETSVESYVNSKGETVPYDKHNPIPVDKRIKSDQEKANDEYTGDDVIPMNNTTPTDQATSTDLFCEQNPELCPNRKMGGPLRMFYHGGSHDDELEIGTPNPFETPFNSDLTFPEQPVTYETADESENVIAEQPRIQHAAPPVIPMIDMQPTPNNTSMTPLTVPSYNEMLEDTPLNEAGSVDQSFGDTFLQDVGGRLNYAGDKIMDTGAMKLFEDVSSAGVKTAGFVNDIYSDINANRKKIQKRSGSTTDALGAYASADAEGLKGDHDQLTGLTRPNDKVASRWGKYGTELKVAKEGVETPVYKMLDFSQPLPDDYNANAMRMFSGRGPQEWMNYNPYTESYYSDLSKPQQQDIIPEPVVDVINNVELEKTLKEAGVDRDLGEGETEVYLNEDGTITPSLQTPLSSDEKNKLDEHLNKEKMLVKDEMMMLSEMIRLKQENPLLSDDVISRMANNNTYDKTYGLGYNKGLTKEQKYKLTEDNASTLPYMMDGGSTSLQEFMSIVNNELGYNQDDMENIKRSLGEFRNGGTGGQVVDIDEQLLQELRAAGADITIL